MKLQTKFSVMGLLAAVVVVAMAVVALWAGQKHIAQAKTLRSVAIATQHLMEADMMHDAMRGDVLAAMLAQREGDYDGIKAVKQELESHYEKFKKNIVETKDEQVPANIKTFLDEALAMLEDYHQAAQAVVSAGLDNQAYALQGFSKQFKRMEDELEMVADEIGMWGDRDEKASIAITDMADQASLGLSILAVLLSLFVPFYAYAAIFKPQSALIDSMEALAGGNLKVEIAGENRSDEIGEIAAALLVFKQNAIAKEQLEVQQKQAVISATEDRKKLMYDLAQRFEEKVQGLIHGVAAAAAELGRTAQSMKKNIDEVDGKARNATTFSNTTAQNVNTVASASEEMAASVQEISNQVTKSTRVVNEAVQKADSAGVSAKTLEEAAMKIGDVVGLIRDIAEQINLLALNATIESARAGEAGRGFAVVASEVKNLASQTTRATEDIALQIEAVQNVSSQVVIALNDIKQSVDNVNQYSSGIASAVEEQSATTNEIAHNMQVAAQGAKEIHTSVEDITNVASHASAASEQMLTASNMLSSEFGKLSSEVSVFLSEIRAG